MPESQGDVMPDQSINIGVVGAGAIGGTTAAFLAKSGWDVEIVCKRQEIADITISRGFHICGLKGEHYIPMPAVKNIKDLAGPKEVVLLATKATDCIEAAKELQPILSDSSVVVSLQNGICEDSLADVLGRDRVVGCVVGWGATMHGPGEIEVTSPGEFVIGNIDHRTDPRLPLLQDMLRAVVPTRISDNIMGELYSKLIINSCINSLGVITGMNLGKLLARSKIRKIFTALMQEAMAVAAAKGIKVEPGGGGKLDYYRFLDGSSFMSIFKRDILIRIIGFKYRRIRSSSLQSLERGRRTEIDFLNGYICDRGREHGVPTPVNDAVVDMIRQIEAGTRKISLENLSDRIFEAL
jgi:2-dehydropantoate 2-reductase